MFESNKPEAWDGFCPETGKFMRKYKSSGLTVIAGYAFYCEHCMCMHERDDRSCALWGANWSKVVYMAMGYRISEDEKTHRYSNSSFITKETRIIELEKEVADLKESIRLRDSSHGKKFAALRSVNRSREEEIESLEKRLMESNGERGKLLSERFEVCRLFDLYHPIPSVGGGLPAIGTLHGILKKRGLSFIPEEQKRKWEKLVKSAEDLMNHSIEDAEMAEAELRSVSKFTDSIVKLLSELGEGMAVSTDEIQKMLDESGVIKIYE